MSELFRNAVSYDLPCRTCGYNLRGLALDGACPECNARIRMSLARDELLYAQPAWLRRVQRGLIAVFAGLGVSVVAAVMVISRAIRFVRVEALWSKIATVGLLTTSVLLIGIGILLCTQPERRLDSAFFTRAVRLCNRVCAVAMMLGAIAFAAARLLSLPQFELAAIFSFCTVSFALAILCPLWLHELLRRTTIGGKEDSAVVGAWLAIGGAMCFTLAALSYQFRWEDGRIGAFLLVPVTALYAMTMFMAIWRTTSAIAWDERAALRNKDHVVGG